MSLDLDIYVISSSDSEDDTFSTLSSGKPTYAKRRKTKTPAPQTAKKEEDDFQVTIPSIFDSIGVKNDQIYIKDEIITQDITKEQNQIRDQYDSLQLLKTNILTELNDNGTSIKYERDSKTVEELVKQSYGEGIIRYFYFLKNYNNNIKSSIPNSLLKLIARSPIQAIDKISNIPEFIESVITSEHNISHLFQINHMFELSYIETDLLENKFEQIVNQYSNHTNSYQLKINHFNNYIPQTLLKLVLIFNIELEQGSCSSQLVEFFLMIICDYNANQEFQYLEYFIEKVFPNIVKFGENDLKQSIFSISTINYGCTELNKIKKDSYELQYNILKNLNVIFNENETVLPIVSRLTVEFYKDYIDFASNSNPFEKLKLTNLLSLFENETGVNKLYHIHFMIKLLHLIISKFEQTNIRQYIEELKKNMLDNINLLGNSNIPETNLVDKQDIVELISENYQRLTNIYKLLDIDFIKDDYFYSDSKRSTPDLF